jgi:hypothetical protein
MLELIFREFRPNLNDSVRSIMFSFFVPSAHIINRCGSEDNRVRTPVPGSIHVA